MVTLPHAGATTTEATSVYGDVKAYESDIHPYKTKEMKNEDQTNL
jgi:hypothetical protein